MPTCGIPIIYEGKKKKVKNWGKNTRMKDYTIVHEVSTFWSFKIASLTALKEVQ